MFRDILPPLAAGDGDGAGADPGLVTFDRAELSVFTPDMTPMFAPGMTAAPGTTAPGITAPGMAAPGTTAPGITAPGMAAPGMAAPGMTAPGTTAPGMTAPGTTAPGMTAPGMTAPGMNAPGIIAPGMVAADTGAMAAGLTGVWTDAAGVAACPMPMPPGGPMPMPPGWPMPMPAGLFHAHAGSPRQKARILSCRRRHQLRGHLIKTCHGRPRFGRRPLLFSHRTAEGLELGCGFLLGESQTELRLAPPPAVRTERSPKRSPKRSPLRHAARRESAAVVRKDGSRRPRDRVRTGVREFASAQAAFVQNTRFTEMSMPCDAGDRRSFQKFRKSTGRLGDACRL